MRVLHVSPHPDDEVLGAGATLTALGDAGHEVTNLAVSLGRRAERRERGEELAAACAELGLALEVLDPPLAISSGEGDDLAAAESRLAAELAVIAPGYDLLVAPTPHDAHPGHEVVGRAVVGALRGLPEPPRLWLWALWSTLPKPTTFARFGEERLELLERALLSHRSQVDRNDFVGLLRARAAAAAVQGPELVGGFASHGSGGYAELTSELVRAGDRWLLGSPRTLDPAEPLPPPGAADATRWIESPSALQLLRGGK